MDPLFLDRIVVSALRQTPAGGVKIRQRGIGSSLKKRALAANELLYHRSISGLRDAMLATPLLVLAECFVPPFDLSTSRLSHNGLAARRADAKNLERQ
jgi:hypothetical protein